MNIKQQVIQTILDNLPIVEGNSLEFFLEPGTFPTREAIGTNREEWLFGFSWLSGLGWTSEVLGVTHFEYDFDTKFKGIFELEDKRIQILGDFQSLRKLNDDELDFLKAQLPAKCRMFVVCVYRLSLTKERAGKQMIDADAVVAYYKALRVPNTD